MCICLSMRIPPIYAHHPPRGAIGFGRSFIPLMLLLLGLVQRLLWEEEVVLLVLVLLLLLLIAYLLNASAATPTIAAPVTPIMKPQRINNPRQTGLDTRKPKTLHFVVMLSSSSMIRPSFIIRLFMEREKNNCGNQKNLCTFWVSYFDT